MTLETAIPELRRPFTPAAVRFKLQTGTMAVAYIDARLVIERLNHVCPVLWSDDYTPIDKDHLLCSLTIDRVTRSDVGKATATEGVKGMYSDAFKRAAVKFGVGICLYGLPRWFVDKDDIRLNQQGKPAGLTRGGESKLRGMYQQWLSSAGSKAFGEPLDHGDVPEAVGDYETGGEQASEPSPAGVKENVGAASQKQKALIYAKADEKKLSNDQLANVVLASVGSKPRTFEPDQAGEWLSRALDKLPWSKVDVVLKGIDAT